MGQISHQDLLFLIGHSGLRVVYRAGQSSDRVDRWQ